MSFKGTFKIVKHHIDRYCEAHQKVFASRRNKLLHDEKLHGVPQDVYVSPDGRSSVRSSKLK